MLKYVYPVPNSLGRYYVIRSIPAYVGQVKAVYAPLLTSIMAQDGWQKVMEKIGEAKPILMSASKYDYSDKNVLIDVLYKFQTSTWETLWQEASGSAAYDRQHRRYIKVHE